MFLVLEPLKKILYKIFIESSYAYTYAESHCLEYCFLS